MICIRKCIFVLLAGIILSALAGCSPGTGPDAFAGDWTASSGMYVDSGEVFTLTGGDLTNTMLHLGTDGKFTLEFRGETYGGTYALYDEADNKYDLTADGGEAAPFGSFVYLSESDSIVLTTSSADVGTSELTFGRAK